MNHCLLLLYYIFNYFATICETFKLIEAPSVCAQTSTESPFKEKFFLNKTQISSFSILQPIFI